MSDVQFEEQSDDTGFEAEYEAARQEQDAPIEDGSEDGGESEQEPEAPVSKDVEKLERIAADKSRAFKAERLRRQEAEERYRQLEARLNQIEQGGQKQQAREIDFATLPDPVSDPIGNLEALRAMAERMAQQQQTQERQTQAQTAQERQFQQINSRMQEFEGDFREMNPDYDDAAKHFREARIAEYQEQGYEGQELENALRSELVGLVARAMQSGKDPAEVVYKLAKNRGFVGSERKEVVDKQPNKLQTIERGQKAARSGSALSGKTGDGSLSMETVSKLDGAAFDQAFAKLREQARRAG